MLIAQPCLTVACQAPLSMGFPRQEYWSGLPFSSGMELGLPHCRQIHYPLSHQGSPIIILKMDTEYFRQLIFKTEQCGQLKGTTCEKDRSPLSILSKKALVQNLNSFKSIKTLIWVQADMGKIIQVTLFYKNAIWDLFGSSL